MSYFESVEYELEEEEFPGCCGIVVMHDFPELENIDDDDRKEAIEAVLGDLAIGSLSPTNGSTLKMAALTDSQLYAGWHHVMRKAGYKRVSRFRNGNTGNIINVYVGQHETNVPPPYKGKSKPKAKAKPRIGMTTTKR